jgi:prepilin peptidase CpaA
MEPGFIACTAIFVLLILWAMWSDLTSLTIPDSVSIGLVLGFLLAGFLAGAPWLLLAKHLGVGVAMFAIGAALFFLGAFGGGDVKMLAAVSVWAGWPGVLPLSIRVAFLGGLLAILILAFRRIPLPSGLRHIAWIERLHRRDGGIPYGLAIGVGALLLLPNITWWQK